MLISFDDVLFYNIRNRKTKFIKQPQSLFMATCIKGRKGYRLCISQKCTEPAVLCRSEDCTCQDKHQNCRESLKVDLEISDLSSRLLFHNEPTTKRFDDLLKRVKQLPNSLPAGLKQWKAQVGLTADQLHLLQLLSKPGNFTLSGSSVHKIDSQCPVPTKQAQQLLLLHFQNLEQLLTHTQSAFRLLPTFKVNNPVSPKTLSPQILSSRTLESKSRSVQEESLKCRQLMDEIEKMKAMCDKMENELQKSGMLMQQKERRIEEGERQKQGLMEHLRMLEEQYVKMQTELEKSNLINSKIKADNARLEKIGRQFQSKLYMLSSQLQRLNNVLKNKISQRQHLQAHIHQQSKQLEDLRSSLKNSNPKSSNDRQLAMKSEIESLLKKTEADERIMATLTREIERLNQRLMKEVMEKQVLQKRLKEEMVARESNMQKIQMLEQKIRRLAEMNGGVTKN